MWHRKKNVDITRERERERRERSARKRRDKRTAPREKMQRVTAARRPSFGSDDAQRRWTAGVCVPARSLTPSLALSDGTAGHYGADVRGQCRQRDGRGDLAGNGRVIAGRGDGAGKLRYVPVSVPPDDNDGGTVHPSPRPSSRPGIIFTLFCVCSRLFAVAFFDISRTKTHWHSSGPLSHGLALHYYICSAGMLSGARVGTHGQRSECWGVRSLEPITSRLCAGQVRRTRYVFCAELKPERTDDYRRPACPLIDSDNDSKPNVRVSTRTAHCLSPNTLWTRCTINIRRLIDCTRCIERCAETIKHAACQLLPAVLKYFYNAATRGRIRLIQVSSPEKNELRF